MFGVICFNALTLYRHTSFLGSGQFGTVNKATWTRCKGTIEVAVKTMKQASKQDRIKFLQEAAIMGQFKHPNIVTLYGLVTTGELVRAQLKISLPNVAAFPP